MKRIKCKYCGAKPRVEYAVTYRGIQMCHDCSCEYAKIFDGNLSIKEKRIEQAFKRGWEKEESDGNLQKIPIPEKLIQYYRKILLEDEQR